MKTRWVGAGGIVFSEESPYPVIRDYNQLLPYIEKLEHDLSVANATINQFANEMVRIKEAAKECIGECGLNGSISSLDAIIKSIEGGL